MGYYHRCMCDDPSGNFNNHDAVLIDRILYRANANFLALENEIIGDIRAIWKDAPND